jgi:glycosyltransferase involved in cell wall biosynthesis
LSLTVLIPCKNEQANIERCIESARLIADEILVADSGSTDDTLPFVRSQGDCRVIEREYGTSGDFKNWAIPQASGDWVFLLDADERLTPKLAAEIRRLFERPPLVDGYTVERENHLMGHPVRYTCWGRDRLLRLFRRDLAQCVGPSDHGVVTVSSGRVASLRSGIKHFTYWSWQDWLRKLDRYSQVQATEWMAVGKKPSWLRMLMQPPLRFIRDFIIHGGILDGTVGLQVAYSSAIYNFMKQARLWEMVRAKSRQDVDLPLPEKTVRRAAESCAR